MNPRQEFAFNNPRIPGRPVPSEFDRIVELDEYALITRVLCFGPLLASMGKWEAQAFVLSESGERVSLIWVADETKVKIRNLLEECLFGVGESGTLRDAELANGIVVSKELTTEEFREVAQTIVDRQ